MGRKRNSESRALAKIRRAETDEIVNWAASIDADDVLLCDRAQATRQSRSAVRDAARAVRSAYYAAIESRPDMLSMTNKHADEQRADMCAARRDPNISTSQLVARDKARKKEYADARKSQKQYDAEWAQRLRSRVSDALRDAEARIAAVTQEARDKSTERYLQDKYSIGVAARAAMLRDQGGKCGSCREPVSFGGQAGAHVDHCHTTGFVRGILCQQCNTMLGLARDRIANLIGGARYLRRAKKAYRAQQAQQEKEKTMTLTNEKLLALGQHLAEKLGSGYKAPEGDASPDSVVLHYAHRDGTTLELTSKELRDKLQRALDERDGKAA